MFWRMARFAWRVWRVSRHGTELERYQLAERLSNLVYPKYRFSEYGRLFLEDSSFITFYHRYHADSHALDRLYVVREFMKLVRHIPGDTAECGVYEGASSEVMCQGRGELPRRHHVFDSFAGLSAPGRADGSYWHEGDLTSPEATARKNLAPYAEVEFHVGWIPSRFPEVEGSSFALVHIDVDLHDPTRDAVAFFYPRLQPGGILLFDDYGFTTCPGATLAIDRYFADDPSRIIMLPTGQAFVMRPAASSGP